ncbi:MAG: sugar ABC transporter permease [Anaerolineaceae bacterium]|nr:sugar ABC transporter permease [Anaerolineaceae bacterium]
MANLKTPAIMKQGKLTPWAYLLPALIVMSVFIVYPMVNTIGLSLKDAESKAPASASCVQGKPCWGIFENYRYALLNEIDSSSAQSVWKSFWASSYGNQIKWLLVMVSGTVSIGLLFAMLVDRIKYEALAKAIIFMPMAISFVGAGVIWKFVYAYGSSKVQIGLLNAIITGLGGKPVSFLSEIPMNTFMLIVVGIWMWTGFCMTILSSAIKAIPEEVIEAARIDGASETSIFFKIMVPIIAPTIVVVITTMVINVLKLFDIVYVMTGGNFSTDVIATRMYTEMYKNFQTGRGTAIAVILVLTILPFIYMNVKRFMAQEAMR